VVGERFAVKKGAMESTTIICVLHVATIESVFEEPSLETIEELT
jgi:hypothetical protein